MAHTWDQEAWEKEEEGYDWGQEDLLAAQAAWNLYLSKPENIVHSGPTTETASKFTRTPSGQIDFGSTGKIPKTYIPGQRYYPHQISFWDEGQRTRGMGLFGQAGENAWRSSPWRQPFTGKYPSGITSKGLWNPVISASMEAADRLKGAGGRHSSSYLKTPFSATLGGIGRTATGIPGAAAQMIFHSPDVGEGSDIPLSEEERRKGPTWGELEKLKEEYPELSSELSSLGGKAAHVSSSEFSFGDAVRWVGDKLGLVDEDLKARFEPDSTDPDLALGRSLSTEAAREEFEKSLAAWAERPLDPVEDMYSGPPEIDEATGAVLTYSMEKGRGVGDMSTAAGRAYEEKFAADAEAWDKESERILERDLAWYASREYKDIEADRLADRKLMETAAAEAEKARLESGARWTEEAPWTFAEGLETLPPWASTRDLYTVPDVKVWGAGRMASDVLADSFAGHSWVAPSGRVMRDKLTPAESTAMALGYEDYTPKDRAIYFPESLTSSVTDESAHDIYKRLWESDVPHRERTERVMPHYLPEWEDPTSGTLYSETALPSTHPDIGFYAGWLPSTRERFDVDAGITYEDVVRDRASLGYTHPEAMSAGMFSDADVGWLTPYRGEEITPESFAALIPTTAMGEFE